MLSEFSQQLNEMGIINIVPGTERFINLREFTQPREWQRQDIKPGISDFRVCVQNLHKLSLKDVK